MLRVKRQINKDTELHPLVRLQFRGLPEEQRKAFLFENVTDVKGKKYRMPVLVGALAGSRTIYAMGMKCKPDEISAKWFEAQLHSMEEQAGLALEGEHYKVGEILAMRRVKV